MNKIIINNYGEQEKAFVYIYESDKLLDTIELTSSNYYKTEEAMRVCFEQLGYEVEINDIENE